MIRHKVNITLYAIIGILLFILCEDSSLFLINFLAISILFIVTVLVGSMFINLNYFVKSINRTQNDLCVLTFDDGPHPYNTKKVLDILKQNEISAIFFIIGTKAEEYPDIIKQIINEGHLIGNHSYSHNNLMPFYSKNKIINDLLKAQEVMFKITSKNNVFFRAPMGITTPNFYRAIKTLNLKSIGWSLRSFDTIIKDRNKLVNRMSAKVKPGSIVLMHDDLDHSADTLDSFIVKAKKRGITFAKTNDIKEIFNNV